MKKEDIQQKSLELSKKYNCLCLEHATGIGKSFSAIKIIASTDDYWYIFVAEIPHIQNWIDEFNKHGYSDLLFRVTIACYDSIHKFQQTIIGGIIADEIHHLTELRLRYLKTIKFNKLIGLSATIDYEVKFRLKQQYPSLFYYKFPLNEAIKHNILPEPSVYLISLEADSINITEKYKFKNKEIKCSQSDKIIHYDEQTEYWKKFYFRLREDALIKGLNEPEWAKNKWLQTATQRKRYISSLKTNAIKQLLLKLKGKRLICFTGSIKQANEIGIDSQTLHSENDRNHNLNVIKNFNEHKFNEIYCVSMLKEGQNLVDIEVGIISQLDNNVRSVSQEIGRILRSKEPIIYILYIKNTRDEDYLINVIETIDKKYINYLKINEL